MSELKAGRELDALVAELMEWEGYHDIHYCEDTWYNYCRNHGCYAIGADADELLMMWNAGDPLIPGCKGYPPYSTDISAAMSVLEWLSERWPGASERLVIYKDHGSDEWCGGWQTLAFLAYEDGTGWVDTDKLEKYQAPMASSETLPEAICHAALKVVESEE